MHYDIYPFKRENKYRLYVRFEDENGTNRNLSTGSSIPSSIPTGKRKRPIRRQIKSPGSGCFVLIKKRGIGKYEPRSIQDRFRKLMNNIDLPKKQTFHSLRHSFANHALEKGASMNGVSKIMGHSTPQVTSRFYDHTTGLQYRTVTDMLC